MNISNAATYSIETENHRLQGEQFKVSICSKLKSFTSFHSNDTCIMLPCLRVFFA